MSAHPNSQDTLEGIVEWWLLEQQIHHAVVETRHALAELVSKRLLVSRSGRDGRVYYRVNRARVRTIRTLLSQRKF